MTEKGINKAIFEKMLENAKDVFNNYGKCEVGTYTLAKLQQNGVFRYENNAHNKVYNIKVENFQCSCRATWAFYLCARFARLAGKKVPVFTKTEAVKPLCTFTIVVPKEAKYLANFVSKNDNQNLNRIFLDVNNSALCASDGHSMKTMRVEITSLVGEIPATDCAYISSKDINKISGRCEVSIYKEGYNITTAITDVNGIKYVLKESNRKYPNYTSIYPKLSREYGYIKFAKDEAKRFTKWLEKSEDTVCLEVCADTIKASRHLECGVFHETATFKLESKGQYCAMIIPFKSRELKKVCESAWDGGVWFTAWNNMAVFDCENTDITLLMPCTCNYAFSRKEVKERNIKVLDRNKALIQEQIALIAKRINLSIEEVWDAYNICIDNIA